jgi:uncharacterized membrane protein YjjP (DUF1212 family)
MRFLVLILLFVGCESVRVNTDMGVTGQVASIDASTNVIDDTVTRAIEGNDTSHLPSVYKETKNIRSQTQEIKRRVKAVLEAKTKAEKKLKEDKKLIWVDLIYRLAPVVLGVVILLIGRFLTQDPSDTKFGIACFLSGIGINAFYDTIGNWGIIIMIAFGIGWVFYSHEKKDLAKKQKATNI